jgi:hypothetical protein
MEFPEIITRLPEAALPFPSSVVKTSVLQSENGQLIFFDVLQAVALPPHSHKAQWGTVVHGQLAGKPVFYSIGRSSQRKDFGGDQDHRVLRRERPVQAEVI